MKAPAFSLQEAYAWRRQIAANEDSSAPAGRSSSAVDSSTRPHYAVALWLSCMVLTSCPMWGVELFTDATLTTPGLTGCYFNRSLETVEAPDDWRSSQTVSGTRIDPALAFTTATWGSRSALGLTGGSDADWNNFSVQWDGWLRVTQAGQRYATVSDDGSRMWIDMDNDGNFEADELLDNGWGLGQGTTIRDRSRALAVGAYRIRIQYYEIGGGNEFHLVSPGWVPRPFLSSAGNPRQMVKVLVLNFEPRIPSRNNQRLWEVFGWSDPRKLMRQFEADVEYATGGAIDIQLVDVRHLEEFPLFEDGFRYSPDQYVQNRLTNTGWHEGVNADFYHLMRSEGVEALVNSGQVDEIWCFGDHNFNLFGEAWMAGPNSFFINGPSFPNIGFNRAIAGFGFNYERGVAEMIHNLSHRTENHGQRAFGNWNLANPVTAFDKFSANHLESSGRTAGVGTCHVPANADGHYDYGDSRSVTSTAFDWANYPATTGATTTVSRNTWGVGPAPDYHRDYLNFYLGTMPRNPGTASTMRQANWFKYIWDFNSYEAGTGLPRNEDAFAAGATVRQAGGTSHDFTVRYYDVTGINANTLGTGDVLVTGPGAFAQTPVLVSAGTEAATTAGTARTATYRITAPGGTWDRGDSGSYRVNMVANQVRDTLNNAVPAGDIGGFLVTMNDPVNYPAPIPVNQMLADGQATVTHTSLDIGPIGLMFDGSVGTLVRTPNIDPAVVTLSFSAEQTFHGFRAYFSHTWGNPAYQWKIETANTQADLDAQTGSWQQTVALTGTPSDVYSNVTLPSPVTAKLARLTATRLTGDDYVHINEWQLLGPPVPDTTPPTASGNSPDVNQPGGTAHYITATFTDSTAVDLATLAGGNLTVTGPNGFVAHPAFHGVDNYFDGSPRTVTYWFIPPGGFWDWADNGSYTLTLQPGSVRDTLGNSAASAQTLGSFTVAITPPARRPPYDLAESNVALWTAGADGGTAAVYADSIRKLAGADSVRFETDGGSDTWLRYPPGGYADWDLTGATNLHFSVYAENSNSPQFQNGSPWIRLTDLNGGWFEYRFYQGGAPANPLNSATNQWRSFTVPLNAAGTVNDGWRRTVSGSPGLDNIASIEFHADTWGAGFRLWYDAVGFDLPENAWDKDLSVSWIERLPRMPFVWNSTNPTRDGWPAEGSTVTWGAVVKNWSSTPREAVSYRWLLNGNTLSTGTVDLAANAWTTVDLPRSWSFNREELRFEIDSDGAIAEFSETNNTLGIWTDAISLGLWVEQSVYDYFHQNQRSLGDGANGWEDWAQRQVGRWNEMFAAAIDPIDAPQGVLDRIRLDKITVVADGALPLAGGLAGNHPDLNDRSVDLMWGFPASQLSSTFYSNHTDRTDSNPFYYEGSLIHELGHARYLIDTYGFNVLDTAANPRVLVKQAGQFIAGTPFLPRSYPWSDHVHIMHTGTGNPFDGLMSGGYTWVDRYGAAAANLIAGRRAVLGNYNASGNIGAFINDLPAANQIQLLDGNGRPLAGANVSIYWATGHSEWYGKQFDDVADLVLTADSAGRVQVGRNPFSSGPLQHTYGISNMVALVKAVAGGRTGFAFIEAGLFNMEYWRGHTAQGRYAVTVPMIGTAREIASVTSWPENGGRRVRIIVGGGQQPQSLQIGGINAFYHEGAWLVFLTGPADTRLLTATWTSGPSIQQTVSIARPATIPQVGLQWAADNPDTFQLSWPTLNGHAYELQRSSNLGEWTPVTNATSFGTGDTATRVESKSGKSSFFRLAVRRLGN